MKVQSERFLVNSPFDLGIETHRYVCYMQKEIVLKYSHSLIIAQEGTEKSHF